MNVDRTTLDRLAAETEFTPGALEKVIRLGDMLAERPDVERAVETLAAAQRYSVQRSADSHAGRKLYLGYLNAAGGADRLEDHSSKPWSTPPGSWWPGYWTGRRSMQRLTLEAGVEPDEGTHARSRGAMGT